MSEKMSDLKNRMLEECLNCERKILVKDIQTGKVRIVCNLDDFNGAPDVRGINARKDTTHDFSTQCPSYAERYITSLYEKNEN